MGFWKLSRADIATFVLICLVVAALVFGFVSLGSNVPADDDEFVPPTDSTPQTIAQAVRGACPFCGEAGVEGPHIRQCWKVRQEADEVYKKETGR